MNDKQMLKMIEKLENKISKRISVLEKEIEELDQMWALCGNMAFPLRVNLGIYKK